LIVAAGLIAGLVQGVLGVGSGSCIMAFLLMTPINTQAASATSGYQVLFIGLAALVQGFINGDGNLVDTAFFVTLCIIFGGLVTLGINRFLRNKNQKNVSKILVFIIFILCMMSVVMIPPAGI